MFECQECGYSVIRVTADNELVCSNCGSTDIDLAE